MKIVSAIAGYIKVMTISKKECALLEAYEDAYWSVRAFFVEKSGYLGKEEGEKLLKTFNI